MTTPTLRVYYDDDGVILTLRSRPDGPAAPIRMAVSEALDIAKALTDAAEGWANHQRLIADVDGAFRDSFE